jgi:hypothetical protein
MPPFFALGLPHGGEWIIVLLIPAIPLALFAILIWAILRRK